MSGRLRATYGVVSPFRRCFVSFWIIAGSVLASGVFQSCTVLDVYDGDTLSVSCDGANVRIRVSSIDAPEMQQTWGRPARDLARSLLPAGQSVGVERIPQRDRYGRVIARITLTDGRDFGRTMVSRGYAFHYVRYSVDPELTDLEAKAKADNLGIWSFGGSERPDEFRAAPRAATTRARRR